MYERRMNTGSANQSRAALARDAALDRISRTRRWVIIGAAGLTAGFAALVSAVAPGRSLASKSSTGSATATASPSSGSSTSRTSIPRMPPPANLGDLGLQRPGQAPSTDQSQPQSTSSPQQSDPSQAPPTQATVSGGS
jgi:hypothetical protein